MPQLGLFGTTPVSARADRPRLLDLYCRIGGAGYGYWLAGWDVTGVDIEDYSNVYPFEFHMSDAFEYLIEHGREYDAIHASPPCQGYTWATHKKYRSTYPTDHIGMLRAICDELTIPLIIENVPPAKRQYRHPTLSVQDPELIESADGPLFDEWTPGLEVPVQRPITLCGSMFGLRVLRHRVFEVGEIASPLPHPKHNGTIRNGDYVTVAGHGGDNPKGSSTLQAWRDAMGIPWAKDRDQLTGAIPPAYTEYLGTQLLNWL